MASDTKQEASSCLNDPNFAIICAFLTKFASKLNVTHPNFQDLQKMLEDTEDVAEDLKNLIIKLLRKNRKTVHLDKWEHALSKFCYGYSAQDAWEIERFGYKKASLTVKLRVLKEIMESQFERNLKFKSDVNLVSADELRSQPLGKDKLGNSYWSMTDEDLNLRIYQEHLDEDIWKVVANSREELVQLIECLKGNAMKMPSLVGLVDEDSSSNSMPALPKIDALRDVTKAPETEQNTEQVPTNVASIAKAEEAIKIIETSPSIQIAVKKPQVLKAAAAIVEDEEDEDDSDSGSDEEDDESNISEIDESSQAGSEAASVVTIDYKKNDADDSKRPSLLASKPPSNKDANQTTMTSKSKSTSDTKIVITKRPAVDDSNGEEGPTKVPKLQRPMLLNNTQQSLKTNKYANLKQVKSSGAIEDDDDDEDDDEEEEEEEEEEEDFDEDDEEKTVAGGAQNLEDETDDEEGNDDDDEVGDEIEEPVMYVKGEGSGKDNKGIHLDLFESDEPFECSELIMEAVLYVYGEGSGTECMVGNTTNDNPTSSTTTPIPTAEKPPMFFFGQPGCLKLSPIKVASPGDNSPEKLKTNLFAENVKDDACFDKSKGKELESSKEICEESKTESSVSNTEAESTDHSDGNNQPVETEIQNDISVVTKKDSSINEAADVAKTCVSPSKYPPNQIEFKEDIVGESLQNNKKTTEELQVRNHCGVLPENSEKSSEDHPKLQEDTSPLKDSDATALLTENIPLMNEPPSNTCELVQQDTILESPAPNALPVEIEKASSLKESIEEQLLLENDLITSSNLKNVESEVKNSDKNEQLIIEPLATPVDILEEDSTPRIQPILTEAPNKEQMEPPDPIVKAEAVALETKTETPISIELKQEPTQGQDKVVEVTRTEAKIDQAIPQTIVQTSNKVETPLPVINVLQKVQETSKKLLLPLTEYSDSSTDSFGNGDTPEDLVSKQTSPADNPISKSPIPVIKVTDAPQSEIERSASSIETHKLQPPNDVNHKDIIFPQSPPSPPLQSFSKPDTPPIPTSTDSSSLNLLLSKQPLILPTIPIANSETTENDVVQLKVTESVQLQEMLETNLTELKQTEKHLLSESAEALQEPEVILKSETEPEFPVSVEEVTADQAALPVLETKELSKPVEPIPEKPIEIVKSSVAPSQENAGVTPSVTPYKNTLIPAVIPVPTATQAPSKEVIVGPPAPSTPNISTSTKTISISASNAPPNYRKRRINLPKEHLSSESSDTSSGQIPSEEEYMAEKRPKMRAKCPQLSARKNAEQKRSVKQAEWSSDEDDISRQLQSKKKLENDSPITVITKPTTITARPGPKSKKLIVENHVTGESSTPIKKNKKEELPAKTNSVISKMKINSNEIDTEPIDVNAKLLVETPTIKNKPGPKSKKQLITEEKLVDMKVNEAPPTKLAESLPNKKRGMDTRNSPRPAGAVTISPTIIKPSTIPKATETTTLLIADSEELKKKPVPTPKPKPMTKKEKEKAKQIATKLRKSEDKAKADEEKLRKQKQSSSDDDDEEMDDVPLKPAAKSTTIQPSSVVKPETPQKKASATKKKKIMGLDVDEDVILQLADGETPVRQSRRIAQIKIKEEAERRDMEEIALKKLKADADRKKKGGISSINDEALATTTSQHSKSSKEKSDSDASVCTEPKPEVKKKKKKLRTGNPWQTDSDREVSDADEEEEIYDKHYESDHRIVFMKSDHEFSCESDVEEGGAVLPVKRARTALKTDEPFIEDDGYACQKCNKHDHPEWILLCDTCDKGYHCSCLVPLLFLIPEGDWFCPPCQQVKLIESLESQLLSFDTVQKERELEEEKRQQAIIASINEANLLPPEKPIEKQRPSAKERRKRRNRTRRRVSESELSEVSGSSKSSRSSNSSSNSSDNEPIYKLRKRKQTVISYRFNEYDDLINTAIKREMDAAEGAANLSRGKQVSTIDEGEEYLKPEGKGKEMPESEKIAEVKVQMVKKEGKGKVMQGESDSENSVAPVKKTVRSGKHLPGEEDSEVEEDDEVKKEKDGTEEESSESEPIKPKILSKPNKKKKKKLNSLDIDSEDDGSDDDFRTSSFSEDEEEDEQFSASGSDSSLDMYTKKKNRKRDTRRSVRARRKRIDTDFINDSDEDDLPLINTRKKKKKEESDSEFNENESTEEEAEDVDSEDLCDDDSDSGSDGAWRSNKKSTKAKKPNRPPTMPTPASAASKALANRKKVKRKEDLTFRAGISVKSKGKEPASTSNNGSGGDDDDDDSSPAKGRRTRGKKLTYMLDDFESSDDGIKPGVKRPDTPPEERAAFIMRQEEIKRMLAEKNTEAAKALAAPKISAIPTPEKQRRAQAVDSLSTVPLQVIQTAKALDVDLKRSSKESDNDTDGFDDDLPEDFDPEDMDEDEIAKMMEEEDFAQHQLKLAGEAIRNKKLKEADALKKKESVKAVSEAVAMPSAAALVPQQTSGPRPSMANAIPAGHGQPVHMMNIQQHGIRGSHGPGIMGPYGPLGPMGSRGPLGPHGLRPPSQHGPPGLHNLPGQHGQQGPPGQHGPPLGQRGAPSQHGSPVIHGLHGPLSQHSPPGSHLQVGPAGPHGPLGQHGPPGQLGSPGSHHPAHLSGPHGPQGMRGPASSPGPQGMYGPHGSHGPPGAHGPQGSHGSQGLPPGQGPHGPGPMGPYGQRGGPHMMYGGPRGPHGSSGLIVAHGPHGPHGLPGAHATHGQHGLQGPHMGPHSSQMPFSMHGVPHGMHPRYGGRGMPMDPHHPMNASNHPPQTVMDYPPDAKMMKLTKLGAEPKKRGRKSKAELQAIEQSKGLLMGGPSISPNVGPGGQHMSQSLHGSSLIASQSSLISGPQEPIIPTTVLSVQNTRLMDPSELGPPGSVDTSPAKKRGRRKKFTPLRETLRAAGGDLPGTPNPPPGIDTKTNPILSERLTASDTRNSLSIATPPQLFSAGSAQPSVITRMPRPPLGSPYGAGGPPPQRYYPPAQNHPPGSISPSPRLTYPNMPPHGPPPLTSGPPPSSPSPSSNVSAAPPSSGTFSAPEHGNAAGPAATSAAAAGRQPSPHAGPYRQPGPHYSGSGGAPVVYPPGPPPPMHRGGLQPINAPPNSAAQEYQSVSPYASPFGSYYPPPQSVVTPTHSSTTVTSSAQLPPQTSPAVLASTPTVTATVAASRTSDEHRVSAVGSFEQYDNAKHTPPHDRTTPNTYQQSPRAIDDESSAGAGSNHAAGGDSSSGATAMETTAGGSSEFSGLVSYFSSQQDDLEA